MRDSRSTGDEAAAIDPVATTAAAATAVYHVVGMTCGHCEGAVESEIGQVKNVTDVTADAATGRVTVLSRAAVDIDEIRAAVDEAGYTLGND